jgi:dUTP pyrophosphatase
MEATKNSVIKVKKLRPDAVIPSKGSSQAAGYDITILEKGKEFGAASLYHTGIIVEPPEGMPICFDLFPRSSIIKTGYILANSIGLIDNDYRGEMMVALIKIDPNAPDILANGPVRIAQLVPKVFYNFPVEVVEELSDTVRAEGGFGSTGTK